MHPDIADSERLAIFVFDSEKMKADSVHWKAFRPGTDGERSFYRVDDLDFFAIAQIGRDARPDRTLHGWAIVCAGKARSCVPLIVESKEPPDRHGRIIGWAKDAHENRSLAQSLAGIAEETVRYPTPPV